LAIPYPEDRGHSETRFRNIRFLSRRGDCNDVALTTGPVILDGRRLQWPISGQFLTNDVGFCRFMPAETTRNQ
jgi:hypothetical protein